MTEKIEDSLLRSSRREALAVGGIWAVAMIYTVAYCSLSGYGRPIENLTFVFGFPDWVFWGILVPWGVCTVVSCWFSYGFMADHDLDAGTEKAAANTGEEDAHV